MSDPRAPEVNLSDEEEVKLPPQATIPIQKTNSKEGRKRSAAPISFLSDIVSKPIVVNEESKTLQKFRENEHFVMGKQLKDFRAVVPPGGIKNDPYKVGNAIVMEINYMAGQLFELSNNLNKLLMYKPKRLTKILSESYQRRLEEKFGENILRHVI